MAPHASWLLPFAPAFRTPKSDGTGILKPTRPERRPRSMLSLSLTAALRPAGMATASGTGWGSLLASDGE
ncbi:hypothetical protein D3C86_1121550 [compost metagenome]